MEMEFELFRLAGADVLRPADREQGLRRQKNFGRKVRARLAPQGLCER